ncbi:MAG: alpha/beta hydrolase-fold protein, partial [Pseudomonadota bacterium]
MIMTCQLKFKITGAVGLAILLSSALLERTYAEDSTDGEPALSSYVLPDTQVFDKVARNGEAYRIFVSVPLSDPPLGGFPVLYVLDGNAMFGSFAETRRLLSAEEGELDKIVIVGIGYPTNDLYDGRRMRDFTPSIKNPILKMLYSGYESGGRDDFLNFLLEELRPEMIKTYRINPYRQSLYGHSLGGLFALHVLYSHPQEFHSII